MEDQFVTYEQALALKELGFNEPCMKEYHNEISCNNSTNDENTNSDLFELYGEGVITSPLKSQVFKWFRDEHNTQSSIEWNKSDHVWFTFKIYFERLAIGENPPVMVGHTINSWLGLNLHFNTYEEAESACIDRLIEILKNKK